MWAAVMARAWAQASEAGLGLAKGLAMATAMAVASEPPRAAAKAGTSETSSAQGTGAAWEIKREAEMDWD